MSINRRSSFWFLKSTLDFSTEIYCKYNMLLKMMFVKLLSIFYISFKAESHIPFLSFRSNNRMVFHAAEPVAETWPCAALVCRATQSWSREKAIMENLGISKMPQYPDNYHYHSFKWSLWMTIAKSWDKEFLFQMSWLKAIVLMTKLALSSHQIRKYNKVQSHHIFT